MIKENKNTKYDLEERTFNFAKKVSLYVNSLPKTISNLEFGKQLVRASGSVGANYIEANEALSKKDFIMRIRISRKESKESNYWTRLTEPLREYIKEKEFLTQESMELMRIFSSILIKSK